jgi:hypothetical protein
MSIAERRPSNLPKTLARPCLAPSPHTCHPEAPSFGAEGSMHSAGSADTPDNSIDPWVRKRRGPQDDKTTMTRKKARFEAVAGGPGFLISLGTIKHKGCPILCVLCKGWAFRLWKHEILIFQRPHATSSKVQKAKAPRVTRGLKWVLTAACTSILVRPRSLSRCVGNIE